MRKRRFVAAPVFGLLAAFLTPWSANAAPGEAAGKATVKGIPMPRLAAAFQMMLISQNQCINYAYDKNGNRTSQTNAALTSTHPVWGTSAYLCFTWSAN